MTSGTLNYAEKKDKHRSSFTESRSFSIPKIFLKSKMNPLLGANHPVELYGIGKVWRLQQRLSTSSFDDELP